MNTGDFFSLILPESGIKYLAESRFFEKNGERKHYFKHITCDNIESMAGIARAMDDEERVVYFACAGFAEPKPRIDRKTGLVRVKANGDPQMDMRTQELATHVKSVWLDIDCGEDKASKGKGYATKKDAVRAVGHFSKKIGLPLPLVVDSGGGIHCYWPFDVEVGKEWWLRVSRVWKAVIKHCGLLSDPARDGDIASVLRPVNTHNRKHGEARVVKALNEPTVLQPKEFSGILVQFAKDHNVKPQSPARVSPPAGPSLNDDLSSGTEYPASSAQKIAEHCNQIREVANSRGDVEEPVWRAMLGVVKHCIEGDNLAHLWSEGHPDYDYDVTQDRLDRWETGPTTCSHFKAINSLGCEGCPHKVNSPIRLGFEVPTATAYAPEEATSSGTIKHVDIPFPYGYDRNTEYGGVDALLTDDEGVVHRKHFSRVVFQPTMRIRCQDGTYAYQVRVHKMDGSVRFVELPASLVSSSKLLEELAKHEIFITNMKDAASHMQRFYRDYAAYLAAHAAEIKTYETYGWHHENSEFVLGDRCYHEDGSVTKILLSGNAKAKLSGIKDPIGHLQDWVDGVKHIYSRVGMEPLQYAICAGFGSVLTEFQNSEYKGIPLALIGGDTAKGKTTTCRVAISAFADPDSVSISCKEGSTLNARSTLMATLKNLPLLIDEVTNIDGKELSALAYATANGSERLRLNASAQLKEAQTWRLMTYLTANDDLHGILSRSQANTQAEAVRIFQINLRRFPPVVLPSVETTGVVQTILNSRGNAGDVFIRYVVANKEQVRAAIKENSDRLVASIPMISEPAYRFYRYHAECTMTAMEITNRIGLTDFDIDAVYDFVNKQLCDSHTTVEEDNGANDEALHDMLNDLAPDIMVTAGMHDGRTVIVEPILRLPKNTLVGRYVTGAKDTPEAYRNRLFLSKKALKDWCGKNRIDPYGMMADAMEAGLMEPMPNGDKMYLAKGTSYAGGQSRVVCINMSKLQNQQILSLVPETGKASKKA